MDSAKPQFCSLSDGDGQPDEESSNSHDQNNGCTASEPASGAAEEEGHASYHCTNNILVQCCTRLLAQSRHLLPPPPPPPLLPPLSPLLSLIKPSAPDPLWQLFEGIQWHVSQPILPNQPPPQAALEQQLGNLSLSEDQASESQSFGNAQQNQRQPASSNKRLSRSSVPAQDQHDRTQKQIDKLCVLKSTCLKSMTDVLNVTNERCSKAMAQHSIACGQMFWELHRTISALRHTCDDIRRRRRESNNARRKQSRDDVVMKSRNISCEDMETESCTEEVGCEFKGITRRGF